MLSSLGRGRSVLEQSVGFVDAGGFTVGGGGDYGSLLPSDSARMANASLVASAVEVHGL